MKKYVKTLFSLHNLPLNSILASFSPLHLGTWNCLSLTAIDIVARTGISWRPAARPAVAGRLVDTACIFPHCLQQDCCGAGRMIPLVRSEQGGIWYIYILKCETATGAKVFCIFFRMWKHYEFKRIRLGVKMEWIISFLLA